MAMKTSSQPALVAGVLLLLSSVVSDARAQQKPAGESEAPAPPDVGVPDVTARAGGDRPTIQKRFAEKAKLLMVDLALMTHVRDDFYDSWGYGLDIAYFPTETWGVELRALSLRTTLDNAAFDLKERIGLVPDARPQDSWLMLGARYSPGYGKFLMWKTFVVHFDPQFVVHGGVATADSGLIPTATLAFSLMTHWRWGIKAKLDLGMSIQREKRERGAVITTGFAPVLGVGWGRNF